MHKIVGWLKVVLPLRADTCATEQKLGMARNSMHNDRVLAFLPLTWWETTQPTACIYYTVIESSAIWLVLPTFWRHPWKPVYSDKMLFLSLRMPKNSWLTRLNKAMENSDTWGHSTKHCHLQTNLRQQKGWEFGDIPYKTVATSVYKFWHWDCTAND